MAQYIDQLRAAYFVLRGGMIELRAAYFVWCAEEWLNCCCTQVGTRREGAQPWWWWWWCIWYCFVVWVLIYNLVEHRSTSLVEGCALSLLIPAGVKVYPLVDVPCPACTQLQVIVEMIRRKLRKQLCTVAQFDYLLEYTQMIICRNKLVYPRSCIVPDETAARSS